MRRAYSPAVPDWPEVQALSPKKWADRARCAREDPELFFPVGSGGPFLEQIRRAKAIGWLCPVKTECLEWALATHQQAGIWGGLTEEERRDLSRAGRPEIAAP